MAGKAHSSELDALFAKRRNHLSYVERRLGLPGALRELVAQEIVQNAHVRATVKHSRRQAGTGVLGQKDPSASDEAAMYTILKGCWSDWVQGEARARDHESHGDSALHEADRREAESGKELIEEVEDSAKAHRMRRLVAEDLEKLRANGSPAGHAMALYAITSSWHDIHVRRDRHRLPQRLWGKYEEDWEQFLAVEPVAGSPDQNAYEPWKKPQKTLQRAIEQRDRLLGAGLKAEGEDLEVA